MKNKKKGACAIYKCGCGEYVPSDRFDKDSKLGYCSNCHHKRVEHIDAA